MSPSLDAALVNLGEEATQIQASAKRNLEAIILQRAVRTLAAHPSLAEEQGFKDVTKEYVNHPLNFLNRLRRWRIINSGPIVLQRREDGHYGLAFIDRGGNALEYAAHVGGNELRKFAKHELSSLASDGILAGMFRDTGMNYYGLFGIGVGGDFLVRKLTGKSLEANLLEIIFAGALAIGAYVGLNIARKHFKPKPEDFSSKGIEVLSGRAALEIVSPTLYGQVFGKT